MAHISTDIPELRDYDTGLVLSNLEVLGRRTANLTEVILAELSELAHAILSDSAGDPDTLYSILLSLQEQSAPEIGESVPMTEGILPINRTHLRNMTRYAGLYERLTLYSFITEQYGRLPMPPLPPSHDLPATAKGRIAYMSNAFADKAYIRFAEHMEGCRTAHFHSFVDACEEVRSGLCEYCILPLENTSDGKLVGFSRLIIKYRLRIVSVCDIQNRAGVSGSITRFALLCKADEEWYGNEYLTQALEKISREHTSHQIEILHTSPSAPSFSDLLAAADFCGLRLVRADTLPAGEEYALLSGAQWKSSTEASPLICGVWDVQNAQLAPFLCFLAIEASEDRLLGLYPLL